MTPQTHTITLSIILFLIFRPQKTDDGNKLMLLGTNLNRKKQK